MRSSLEPVLEVGATLGESPIWDDRTGTLLWVDIHRHQVHRFDPASATDRSIVLEQPVGAVALREGGGLVGAVGLSVGVIDEDTASFAPWHTVNEGTRMNDGACDPGGRYLAGTLTEPLTQGASALFCLEPDGRFRRLLGDVTLSNGISWSADGNTMYYIDTFLERVDAFDYDPETGGIEVGSRRTILDLREAEGRPDGMTIDTEGNLWVAMARGRAVRCYDTRGRLLHLEAVPAPVVTSCTFGGADFADLYITTGQWPASGEELREWPRAGAVFRLSGLGVQGRPAQRFAG
ncbi:SMP-30/gluconolactonase/LRE family protein [Sinomonas sp. P47F7]|uniref:SMP-30/gluconolactonase/LRE family protein n=1 Tax=Sinomonas sp. P47F7 TaxID=3410987 RepID=UPI003BF5266A